jgi:uncharacterized membrane protein
MALTVNKVQTFRFVPFVLFTVSIVFGADLINGAMVALIECDMH